MLNINSENFKDFSIPFKPIYEPYNDAASRLTEKFHTLLDLPDTPKMGSRYRLLVASFLAAFQAIKFNDNHLLSIGLRNAAYTEFPEVGWRTIRKVYNALIDKQIISLYQLGTVEFTNNKNDPSPDGVRDDAFTLVKVPTLCVVDDSIINDDDFWEAEFIEVGRPLVAVGKYQSKLDRHWLKVDNKPTPKVPANQLEDEFGKPYTKAVNEVERLNAYWRRNPICIPKRDRTRNLSYKRYAACASRIYHQGSMQKGGRFYGLWTTVRKEDRKTATINGNATVQLDIAASQPTLFSCFMGEKMICDNWTDIYQDIVDEIPPSAAKVFGKEHRRAKVKQAIMELIGVGRPTKAAPERSTYKVSDTEAYSFSEEVWGTKPQSEFVLYCNLAKYVIPALQRLDSKLGYDTHFLSYHEASIMHETLVALIKKDIVAYPLHDCLIVELGNEQEAADTYRTTINDYCKRAFKVEFSVSVPLTIERQGQKKETIAGYYY